MVLPKKSGYVWCRIEFYNGRVKEYPLYYNALDHWFWDEAWYPDVDNREDNDAWVIDWRPIVLGAWMNRKENEEQK